MYQCLIQVQDEGVLFPVLIDRQVRRLKLSDPRGSLGRFPRCQITLIRCVIILIDGRQVALLLLLQGLWKLNRFLTCEIQVLVKLWLLGSCGLQVDGLLVQGRYHDFFDTVNMKFLNLLNHIFDIRKYHAATSISPSLYGLKPLDILE